MLDYFIFYNSNKDWSEINKILVDNIIRLHKDQARIHIYGVDDTEQWDNTWRPKRVLNMIDTMDFQNGIMLDSDCLVMKKLDVFMDASFDVGLTIRKIPFYAPNKNIPMHNYFNQGIVFFRKTPGARKFFLKWLDNMNKAYCRGAKDSFVDQSAIAFTALNGVFSTEGIKAYKEGLAPNAVFDNDGTKIKIFDCFNYNSPMPKIPKEQYILHFKDDIQQEHIRTQMLRLYSSQWGE